MEIEWNAAAIRFEKVLNPLDEFTIAFTEVLEDNHRRYVLISGYVAILFGRNRASEDVDLFLEQLDEAAFGNLWDSLHAKGFTCVNATTPESAYRDYLTKDTAVRFCHGDEFIPNMEVKFPKDADQQWALSHRRKVIMNGHTLFISPIETQIPFKLALGSEKDIEDARYLYRLFGEHLDEEILKHNIQKLHVQTQAERYLR